MAGFDQRSLLNLKEYALDELEPDLKQCGLQGVVCIGLTHQSDRGITHTRASIPEHGYEDTHSWILLLLLLLIWRNSQHGKPSKCRP